MPAPHISDYYTPLYDTEHGGPPRAFRCACPANLLDDSQRSHPNGNCLKVTRTEAGMWMHLVRVHGIRRQKEMFE